jgi:8-oxo-dGTP diphosphatase
MLQFGVRKPATDYRHRAVAFGVVEREGLIACVRVERASGPYFDLPGGGLDLEETEVEALRREFVEETGLTITPLNRIAEASQYFIRSTDEPLNNVGGFWTARVVSEDPTAKCEDDHTLVGLHATCALSRRRHDAHAWAVAVWLRRAS